MIDDAAIKLRYAALGPVLDERGRRRFAAAEALAAGRGGVTAVARRSLASQAATVRLLRSLGAGDTQVSGQFEERAARVFERTSDRRFRPRSESAE